jgi:chromosome segregation ATPase
MAPSTEYEKAYESAKQELADLLAKRQEAERRIVLVRQSLQTLASLCESEGVEIQPSTEASYLLERSTLADEIRTILKAASPEYLRPRHVKFALERLGHDLGQYQNPQATIHMVLKRMAESGEVEEIPLPRDGKKTYRISGPNSAASLSAEQGENKHEKNDEKNLDAVSARALLGFMPGGHTRGRGRRGSRGRHGRRG